MSNVIDFDAAKCLPYLRKALLSFLSDPPDSDYQRGFLAGILAVYQEALGKEDDLVKLCQKMLVDKQ